MPAFPDEPISKVRQRLIDGMASYMQPSGDSSHSAFDPGYTRDHIDRCVAIVDSYLAALSTKRPLTEAQIRAVVERAVLELNALNRECGGGLIETDQREDLCQLILVAARKAGLATHEDITEEWRDW